MTRKYNATLDNLSKGLTVFVSIVILAGLFVAVRSVYDMSPSWERIFVATAGVFLVVAWLYCYFFRPVGYIVTDDTVIIKRPASDKHLSMHDIKSVVAADHGSMRWSMRIFGNGGLFGYTGFFRNSTFGIMRWYATRRSNYVVLVMNDDRKVVVTPDDPSMAASIEKAIARK